jgi:hypothetical protein
MKIFNNTFSLGLGQDLFIIILAGAGSYLMYWWFSSKDLSDVSKVLEGGLEAPPFPSDILADYNWTMKSLDGKDFNMTEAKGKVVFLNFWATGVLRALLRCQASSGCMIRQRRIRSFLSV